LEADDSFDDTSLDDGAAQPAEGGSFELSLAEFEAIVHDLEDGQLGLAESLARYEQGVKHLKHCVQLLANAERKIDLLTSVDDDGTPLVAPFDGDVPPMPASAGRKRSRKAPSDIDG
jgi:exodeoxyribonuclease VII small subunit